MKISIVVELEELAIEQYGIKTIKEMIKGCNIQLEYNTGLDFFGRILKVRSIKDK